MKQSDKRTEYILPEDQFNLAEIFSILLAEKLIIGITTLAAALLSIVISISLPNIYTATALLAPTDQSESGMSGLMKQYGGIASMAGISLPQGQGGRSKLALEMMKSRKFLTNFVERREILPELMASKSWDSGSGKINYDRSIFDSKTRKWNDSKPSKQKAYREINQIISIYEDPLTFFVSISIEHKSPIIAANWVNWLVEDVNNALREQDVLEATQSIEYLKQQIASTPLSELQSMFSQLIQKQTETIMLAEVRPEYVFKTIDPAIVPEQKSKPSRSLIVILSTLLGAIISILFVLARHFTDPKAGDHS